MKWQLEVKVSVPMLGGRQVVGGGQAERVRVDDGIRQPRHGRLKGE